MDFIAEKPWPLSECQNPFFYHSMDFPDGTSCKGHWDIRGRFHDYIGRYPIAGKSVLDVGTATGFLAFSAEQAGARVTALDVPDPSEIRSVPFRDSLYHRDQAKWIKEKDAHNIHPLKKSFWYSWHRLNSSVEVVYAPLDQLYQWERKFDVVLAGAIIEHISDPVSAIGQLARLANEAVIIAFTHVVDTDEWLMRPSHDMSNPALEFEWWLLSRGLYRQIFDNLGFTIEITAASAIHSPYEAPGEVSIRPTIIARRKTTEQLAQPRVTAPVAAANNSGPWHRLRRLVRLTN